MFIRFNSRPLTEPRRAALLERLLARACFRRRQDGWRAYAYGLLTAEPMPGLAAAALAGAVEAGAAADDGEQTAVGVAAAGESGAAADGESAALGAVARIGGSTWVYFATPVHHTAGMSSVSLSAEALLTLARDEAQSLALDFNRVFGGGGLRLVVAAQRLYLKFPSPVRADTHDPKDAVQGDLWDFLPGGPDGAYLRGLMSEMEMWLFDHPINRERLARGAPAITGLWLWGGGPSLAALPEIRGWTAGNDPFFGSFAAADLGGEPHAHGAATRAAKAGAAIGDGAGHGVVVVDACPGTPTWDEAEARWLRPALARLRSGTLDRLELSSGDWLFGVKARWRFRIWRKTLPWWEHLR